MYHRVFVIQGFSNVVEAVEETGSIMREIRDIEEQIDNINEVELMENVKQIENDLKQVKEENQEMIQRLKGKKWKGERK